MIRVAINGFGRIGRGAFKVWFEKHRESLDVVAINDLVDAATLAHLLKYDTYYGVWDHAVEGVEGILRVDGVEVKVYTEKEPENLPWGKLGVDVVIESTGKFTKMEEASTHITAGAKKVVVSAPATETLTLLVGVNDETYAGETVINNASCTTNSIAPVAKVINETFGVKKVMMTTVHAMTAEQNLVDGPPPGGKAGDLRRARSAHANIIPTTTGAAIAATEALPDLKGKFDGVALRVPVGVGSISDLTFIVGKATTKDEVNKALQAAANTEKYRGILSVIDQPIVSSDIIGRPESAIVDLSLTQVVDGDMVKIFAWYDNEYGYSNRLVEQVIQIGKIIR